MNTKLLDILNACFDALGEDQISSLDDGHPEYANVNNIISRERKRLLGKGWYFNKQKRTFFPNVQGKILLPDNILDIEPVRETVGIYSDLGGTLYNNEDDTNIFEEQVELYVVLDYPELNIPFLALDYLSSICQVEAMRRADITGMPLESKLRAMEFAGRKLLEQDLRSKDLNMNNTSMRRQLGTRTVHGAPIHRYKNSKYRG